MSAISEQLPQNSVIIIYFFYGLAFFSLGLAVALEAQRSASKLPFARALLPLAAFGLIHGAHNWLEVFTREELLHGETPLPLWVESLRVTMLALSFLALLAFGIKLLYPEERPLKNELLIAGGAFLLWLCSVLFIAFIFHPGDAMSLTVRSWLRMADTWGRYTLAIPGAIISGYALWRQARELPPQRSRFAHYLYVGAVAFLVYGLVGQLFVTRTYLFPSQVLNATLFEQLFGIPVQLFRAVLAMILAFTLIPTLSMFELERQKELAAAEQSARDELSRREELRREMLQHTVQMQEEERRRISRELHDEIGQTLTALSLGLQILPQTLETNQEQFSTSIQDLHRLTVNAVSQLSNLVTDLRPSQLDHMGLKGALRSLVTDYRARFQLKVTLSTIGEHYRLPANMELAIYRIAQEALTNIVRHANVNHADVQLCYAADQVRLMIDDEGIGFNPTEIMPYESKHWGMLNMTERANQLGGTLQVEAATGEGTKITVCFPVGVECEKVLS